MKEFKLTNDEDDESRLFLDKDKRLYISVFCYAGDSSDYGVIELKKDKIQEIMKFLDEVSKEIS